MTTRAAASMHNATASEHDGDTMEMVRNAVAQDRLTESNKARDAAFRKLVSRGLPDTIETRLACSIMWGEGASWALGVMKEEIER
jgi:hypothetical protein